MKRLAIAPLALVAIAAPATAAPTDVARETLVKAAFGTTDKAQALALINRALASLAPILVRSPNDRDALLQQGIALGYRGQINRGPGDAKAARDILSGLAQRYPNDAEAQGALGAWNLTVVETVGGFIGKTVLGASKSTGMAAFDKAVRLDGSRAFISGLYGLLRLSLDPKDAIAPGLIERAARGQTPFEIDRIMRDSANRVLPLLKAGNTSGASDLAKRLLPFGRIG